MRFRCYNRRCSQGPPRFFEFEGDGPLCPKCGAHGRPRVIPLTDVHFLVMGEGPLTGAFGEHHVACEPDRPHLALHPHDGYAASDVPQAVTCPKCRGTKAFQDFVRELFPTLWAEMQGEKAKKPVVVDLGKKDCGCG